MLERGDASPSPQSNEIKSFAQLDSVANSSFALECAAVDRSALQRALCDEKYNLAFGAAAPNHLLDGLAEAVSRSSSSFYTMLEVTRANVASVVGEWLSHKPLGELSADLESLLLEDLRQDVCRFICATGSRAITLRLILEHESGCRRFEGLLNEPDDRTSKIEAIIDYLEYNASYLLHCDEDMVNQIKTYVGAPTIALHHTQLASNPSFDRWFEIFRGGDPQLETKVENLLAAGNAEALAILERQLEMDIAEFQLELPGLGANGAKPFHFILGRPHLYFGAQDKIEGKLGFATPKGLLHARPAIWAQEEGAKRFSAILDTPSDIQLCDLFD